MCMTLVAVGGLMRNAAPPHLPVIRACHWVYEGAGRPQLFVGLMERLHLSDTLRVLIKADGLELEARSGSVGR